MNFCSDALSPTLKSSKPCADGYELENLIKTRPRRIKGFCSEGFTRPPIDISVEFPIAIDIARIIIGTKLKEKCSTGFSLSVTPDDSISKDKLKKSLSDPCSSKSEGNLAKSSLYRSSSLSVLAESHKSQTSDGEIQFCIGRWFTNSEPNVLLKNLQYRHWLNFPLPDLKLQERAYEGTLKHPSRFALKSVKSLTLSILRVAPTGSPVLSSLEVWGQPAVSSDPSLRKHLLQKWLNRGHIKSEASISIPRIYNSQKDDCATSHAGLRIEANAESPLDIPDEFLDPLTCEVMVIPLLLPSGNSIDAHSLERFIANEAIWGRPPADPFTGVQFRKNFKPVPNGHLKSRIDRFLLIHNPLKFDVSQTVSSPTDPVGTLILGRSNLLNLKRKAEEDRYKELGSPKKRLIMELHSDKNDGDEAIMDPKSSPECIETNDINKDIEKTLKGKPSFIPRRIVTGEGKPNPNEVTKQAEDSFGRSKLPSSRDGHVTAEKPPLALRAKEGSRHYVHTLGAALHDTQKQPSQVEPLYDPHCPKSQSCSDLELPRPPHLTTPDDTSKDQFSVTELYNDPEYSCPCGIREVLYALKCQHVTCRQCLLNRNPLPFGAVQCQQCGTISHRPQISRMHPISMFA